MPPHTRFKHSDWLCCGALQRLVFVSLLGQGNAANHNTQSKGIAGAFHSTLGGAIQHEVIGEAILVQSEAAVG
eukprot:2092597-Alexandrium_andersonii.AAC.2